MAKSRREGKARRDGATVSTRVVGLAESVGEVVLFGDDGLGQGGSGDRVGKGKGKEKEEIEMELKRRFRRRSML